MNQEQDGMDDDMGGEGLGPQGGSGHPLSQRGRGPHDHRRGPPPGLGGGMPSQHFNSDGMPPLYPQGDGEDFSEESMLQPRQGHMRPDGPTMGMRPGAGMNMPPMDDEKENGMQQFGGTPRGPHHAGAGFGRPPFEGGQPSFGHGPTRRPGGMMRGGPMGESAFPPPKDFNGPPPGLGGDDEDFTGGPGNFARMLPDGEDMGFGHPSRPTMHNSFDRPPGQAGSFPRRQRRSSESNLPASALRESAFGRFGGTRDSFGNTTTRNSFGTDDDSALYFGSDPTDNRSRRDTYDREERSGHQRQSRRPKQILFYDERKPYYGFSNSAPYSVLYRGRKYPTAEHLYHSFKVRS